MDKTKTDQRTSRTFSVAFKRQKVKELDSKQVTVSEIVKLYEVSATSVYRWLQKYSLHYQKPTRVVVEMETEALKTQELLARNAELERIIGQKQLEIDYLNQLISLASVEFQIDLKKNTKLQPSSISANSLQVLNSK